MTIERFPRVRGEAVNWNICKIDSMVNYLSKINVAYEPMFLNSLMLEVDNNTHDIQDIFEVKNAIANLELYCGVIFREKNEDIMSIKDEYLRHSHVILGIDAYYCPWMPELYSKVHNDGHAIVVKDFGEKSINFLDPWASYEGKVMIDDISPGYKYHLECEYVNLVNELDLLSEFKRSLHEYGPNRFVNSYSVVVNTFYDEINNLDKGKQEEYSSLFQQIEFNHISYSVLLDLINDKYGEYESITLLRTSIISGSNDWRVLYLYLQNIILGHLEINPKWLQKCIKKVCKSIDTIYRDLKAVAIEVEIN